MESIWHKTARCSRWRPLSGDIRTEAAVIGGGLAGILTAALLQEEGVQTVLLEADRIGSGQTGNTTAKVTSQHGLIYRRLETELGPEAARQYAQANQQAIEQYQQLIRDRGIHCCWERLPLYLYSTSGEEQLALEAEAAERAGLPAEFTRDTGLPFPVKGAVRIDRQAQFHPLRFLFSLAEGLRICEDTRAAAVEGDQIRTEHGTVRSEHIIFACHYPFVNFPGYYFTRLHQERSYVLALENAQRLPAMYYSADGGGTALRWDGDTLLLSGGTHRTGENRGGGQYGDLTRRASLLFPGCRETARWSAQDCVTADGVPYIGRFSASTPNWYVATGFGKWGMTTAMAAASILRELVLGREIPQYKVFSPQRFTPAASAQQLLQDGLHAVQGLGRQLLSPPRGAVEALPPGHGGVVEVDGGKVGVYRAPDGAVFTVDIRCPHLGCQLEWNPEEKSWDCPCHGSRFDYRGRLLSGPAQRDLTGDAVRQ